MRTRRVRKVTFKRDGRRVTLPISICRCGHPAMTKTEGSFTIVECIHCKNRMKVMGRERSIRLWNKRNQIPKGKNSSGAVDSCFGDGTTEAEKDFGKKSVAAPKTADSLDRVDDRKVGLAEWVEIIDAKHGNTIGFRRQEEVFDLVQTDERFRGNVTEDGTYQLFYNPNWARGNFLEVNCTSLEQYVGCIKSGQDVVACDDPVRRVLQASYLLNGNKYVTTLSLSAMQRAFKFKVVNPALLKAIEKNNTQGIIDFLAKQKTGEENEPR